MDGDSSLALSHEVCLGDTHRKFGVFKDYRVGTAKARNQPNHASIAHTAAPMIFARQRMFFLDSCPGKAQGYPALNFDFC